MAKKRFVFSAPRLVVCIIWFAFLFLTYFILPTVFDLKNKPNATTDLVFHTVDVGQGDCTIVEFPDDKVLMIDTGTKDKYPKVKSYLDNLDITTINWFVNSHPDNDHMGGLPLLINDFDIDVLYRSPYQSGNSDFLEIAGNMLMPEVLEKIVGSNYVVTFVSPYESDIPKISNSNDSSLMMTIEYKNKIFVMTGDASAKMETLFIERAPMFNNLESKQIILKVGHHGSGTSSGTSFLDFIFNPVNNQNNYAIISCGTTYGHPNFATVSRLKKKCASDNIFVTKDTGNIVVVAGEKNLTINDKDYTIIYTLIFIVLGLSVIFLSFYNYKVRKTQYIDISKK